MKSLSLSKPLVIIMVGLPGSGKTFFARQFSETFSAPIVSYERIRHALFSEPSFSKDEESKVEMIASYQTGELLKTHRSIIIDGGGSTRVQRAEIYAKAKAAGYGVLIIWPQVDEKIAKRRSLKRTKSSADDAFTVSLNDEQFQQFVKKHSPPSTIEQYVVISGRHTYATQVKVVLRKIVTPREEAPIESDRPARSRAQDSQLRPRNISVR